MNENDNNKREIFKISLPPQKILIQGSISQAVLLVERTQLPKVLSCPLPPLGSIVIQ